MASHRVTFHLYFQGKLQSYYSLLGYSDQFVLYEDGYGNHVGRLKDMIIRGGENIFPIEIEYFLETHPSISQVQVIII